METKRCTYCHKLQRVGNRVCSCCGRPFDRYSSRSGRSRSNSRSLFSLPAASPHRIGHYSGLHPEDQPYQSQMMIMPQRFIQEMQEKKALQEGPKHIVLPSLQNTPVGNRRRSISQAPIHSSFPTRRSRRRLTAEQTLRGNQQTQGTVGRDVERERGQISRPFVREVISPGAGTSPVPTGISVHTKRGPSRMLSTVVISAGFCVLLTISISVLILLSNHVVPAQAHKGISHTPPLQTIVPTPSPRLQIPTKQAVVPTAVATSSTQLSISTTSLSYSTAQSQSPDNQKITISNIARQSLPWDATTQNSPSWLTLSLYHGLIPPGVVQSITVSVTSQDLATGTYTELISFIDHANAQVMAQVQVTLTVTPGNLIITPSSLALTTQQPGQTLSLQNNSGFSLDWTVTPSTTDQGNWLSVTSSSSGTLAPGDSVTVSVSANATSLAPGTYQGLLTFSAGGQTQQVAVSFVVTGTPLTPTPTG